MNKKDLLASVIIGGAVGLLAQPMLTTLADTLTRLGLNINLATRSFFFLFFLVLAPLALYIASLIGKLYKVIYQFAKFAAVGSLNSFIDFGFMNLMIALTAIASGTGYVIFKAISFLLATTNSFAWNKFWTFGAGGSSSTGEEAKKFYIIALVGWGLNVGAASLLVNYIPHPSVSNNLWANAGALLGIAVSFLWNFLGYKFFVFVKRTETTA